LGEVPIEGLKKEVYMGKEQIAGICGDRENWGDGFSLGGIRAWGRGFNHGTFRSAGNTVGRVRRPFSEGPKGDVST